MDQSGLHGECWEMFLLQNLVALAPSVSDLVQNMLNGLDHYSDSGLNDIDLFSELMESLTRFISRNTYVLL